MWRNDVASGKAAASMWLWRNNENNGSNVIMANGVMAILIMCHW
jgi:hypothetical protein